MNRFIIRILLVVSALSLPSTLMAQREYSPNFAIGGRAGVTMSRMSFSPEVHQKFANGMTMGVAARYTEERFFGLIAEINLTQRGWAEDFARDEAPEFSYTRTLTYVSIPLLTHIYFGSNKVRGFFNLGPEISFMISWGESRRDTARTNSSTCLLTVSLTMALLEVQVWSSS